MLATTAAQRQPVRRKQVRPVRFKLETRKGVTAVCECVRFCVCAKAAAGALRIACIPHRCV